MIRTIFRLGLALGLVAFVGCGQDDVTQDDLPTAAEGARTINENPSTETVNVPGTGIDEAQMGDEPAMPPAGTEGDAPPEPAEPADEPNDDPADEPADESNDDPADEPADESNDDPADEPNDDPED